MIHKKEVLWGLRVNARLSVCHRSLRRPEGRLLFTGEGLCALAGGGGYEGFRVYRALQGLV